MKTLSRTQFGNPILRQKAKRVSLAYVKSAECKTLIQNMFYTIRNIGVGLAAPQIDLSLQLAVIHIHTLPHRSNVESFRRVIVNPKILAYSREIEYDFEGCLSLDGVRGSVPRSTWIRVSYSDEHGKKHVEKVTGFVARVFQHEIDHLNGALYVDRMKDVKTLMTVDEFNKLF